VIVGGLLAIALILAIIPWGSRKTPPFNQTNTLALNPPPAQVNPPPPQQQRAYAGEMVDFGIPPKAELESNVGTPTPMTIPVGQRLTTEDVQRMLGQTPRPILIDVLEGQHPQTLPDALYMPAGGMPGSFDDAYQTQFAQQLGQTLAADASRPLIFFCQGASCWESYNAALRANAAGYGNIYWYRGGLSAWQEAGLTMSATPAPYGETGQGY
jgi:PQQ-dependent catabolism-associated CXXCW motif protein